MFESTKNIIAKSGLQPTILIEKEYAEWLENKMAIEFIKEKTRPMNEIKDKWNKKNISLPNGQVGKNYNESICLGQEYTNVDAIFCSRHDGLEIEKNIDQDNNITITIKGRPCKGDDSSNLQKIAIAVSATSKGNSNVDLEPKHIQFVINPDPRDLWKNIPTDTNIEYYKEDSQNEGLDIQERTVVADTEIIDTSNSCRHIIAASQRGRSHAHEGRARDDHYTITNDTATGWNIIAVADGAGSAKFSREGSKIACNTITNFCRRKLEEMDGEICANFKNYIQDPTAENRKTIGNELYTILASGALTAQRKITEESQKKEGSKLKDYATTLLVAITKEIEGKWFIGTFWVGDGAVGIYKYTENGEEKEMKVLGTPDEGEFAGQTRFLTMPEIFANPTELFQRLRFLAVDDFKALMLMTDGVSDAKFECDANLQNPSKWDEVWEDITKEVNLQDDAETASKQLLNWLGFWSQGNHDDRTIAIMY